MSEATLSGVRVLDLSERIAGPYCAKLFADLGADVIKIEPLGRGDAARQLAPFVGSDAETERSALFLHLNTNKRSAALDLGRDRDRIAALARDADIVVESAGPGALSSRAAPPARAGQPACSRDHRSREADGSTPEPCADETW